MSKPVSIDDLFDQIGDWGAAAIITSSGDNSRVVAVIPTVDGDDDGGGGGEDDWGPRLRFGKPGKSTLANVLERPAVVLYFAPHAGSDGYSLIVDGVGALDGEDLIVQPTSAVLHRPPPQS